jgi:type VI secretion system protein ImpM
MLKRLTASWLVTPPAIWGKLPAHPDFIRSGMRHGESEGWRPWLVRHGRPLQSTPTEPVRAATGLVPAAFVLQPGTLAFAPRQFVMGVIVPCADRLGRQHPLLVYQLARARWVRRYFAAQAQQPRDWLFWLSRAVGQHLADPGCPDIRALHREVHALWAGHAPRWPDLVQPGGSLKPGTAGRHTDAARERASHCESRSGKARLPWTDWPQGLHRPNARSAFWQQDDDGGYSNADVDLQRLWRTSPRWQAPAASTHAPPLAAVQGDAPETDAAGLQAPALPPPAASAAHDLADRDDDPPVIAADHADHAGDGFASAVDSGDGRSNPFGILDIAGAPERDFGNTLAELLGEAPATPSASSTTSGSAPSALARQVASVSHDAAQPGIADALAPAQDRLLRELHQEFDRAVQDPTQIGLGAVWNTQSAAGTGPAPGLDDLRHEAGKFALLRDILEPRQAIDQLIHHFDSQEPSALLDAPRPQDVLGLFTDTARAGKPPLPTLTRRDHHNVSPDSHVQFGARESDPQPHQANP